MNKIIFFLLLVVTIPVLAQEEILIIGEVESGGFRGPVLKMTNINSKNAVLVGDRGGWIINHSFVLGGGGYGLVTDVNAKVTDSNHQYIEMGYGGYITSSNDLLHLSIGLLVGGGGIGYRRDDDDMFNASQKKTIHFLSSNLTPL